MSRTITCAICGRADALPLEIGSGGHFPKVEVLTREYHFEKTKVLPHAVTLRMSDSGNS
jgi:hypothetical protein